MRQPSAGRSRTPNTAARPRPPSNGPRPQTTTFRGSSANRERSKSPRNQQPAARGRSTEKKTSSYSAEVELDPALECLQFYSRYSKSPNDVRKQSVPGIFRRPLTPKSKEHLKKTYFFATSGETRFKDVRTKGFCLRCYGNNHLASDCKIYTRPTPTPCRQCMHLFHPTNECRYYNTNGTSRPPSKDRSSSRGK